jgi:hypothetical protein
MTFRRQLLLVHQLGALIGEIADSSRTLSGRWP